MDLPNGESCDTGVGGFTPPPRRPGRGKSAAEQAPGASWSPGGKPGSLPTCPVGVSLSGGWGRVTVQSMLLQQEFLGMFFVPRSGSLTAFYNSVFQKKEFDVDTLSKSELRMLLSVMEGELEARDLVIEALRVRAF